MNITVPEYNRLKDSKYNLTQNIKYSEAGPEKIAELKRKLNEVEKKIAEAEKEENIQHYLDLLRRKIRLQQTIGSWKYYKKDTTQMEVNLKKIMDEVAELESEKTHMVVPLGGPLIGGAKPTSIRMDAELDHPDKQPNCRELVQQILKEIGFTKPEASVNQGSEPTYYIINLAWSKEENNVINAVRDFLNMSNYIESYSEMSDERDEYVMTWKYAYDSIEEQASVKALRMCACHLLDVLKTWNPDVTDAEVFGKAQKY